MAPYCISVFRTSSGALPFRWMSWRRSNSTRYTDLALLKALSKSNPVIRTRACLPGATLRFNRRPCASTRRVIREAVSSCNPRTKSEISASSLATGFSIMSRSLSNASSSTLTMSGDATARPERIRSSTFSRFVGQIANLIEVEEARAALDRMRGTENFIHPRFVYRGAILLHLKQVAFDAAQMLAAFGEILLHHIIVNHPNTLSAGNR